MTETNIMQLINFLLEAFQNRNCNTLSIQQVRYLLLHREDNFNFYPTVSAGFNLNQ